MKFSFILKLHDLSSSLIVSIGSISYHKEFETTTKSQINRISASHSFEQTFLILFTLGFCYVFSFLFAQVPLALFHPLFRCTVFFAVCFYLCFCFSMSFPSHLFANFSSFHINITTKCNKQLSYSSQTVLSTLFSRFQFVCA